jgi:ABC-type transport system involved in multi-copper enzyme maturation permease subunit
MATRAIKPKRDEGPLGGWQSLPERAPSVLRADRPLGLRLVAFAALVLTAVGGLAMILPSFNRPYLIGPYWGFFWFSIGVAGLIYHALCDREIQYRRTYAILGLVLFFSAVILRFWPLSRAEMGKHFLSYGVPCLALSLVFLLAVVRHETDAFWRKVILRILGIGGAVMVVAGFFFSNVNLDFGFLQNRSSDFLQGEGVVLTVLGLFFVGGFIAMQESGSQLAFRSGLAMGAIGLAVFVLALWRSIYPTIMNLPPDQAYLVPEGLVLIGLGLVYLLFGLGVCCDWVPIVMTRRELAAFFYSPIAYLVILGMTLIGWFMFATFLSPLTQSPMQEPIVSRYVIHFIPVICLIFVVPVLTMRLLSEEKRSGTLEVLLTAPVSEVWVVLSKFFACLIFFLISLMPWGLYLVALRVVGKEAFDYRPMLAFFIALGFSGAGFLAIGLFFSSITKNQIIAAVLTFAIVMAMTVVFWLADLPAPWNDIFSYISYLDLWINSMQGQFAPRMLMFHLSVAVFFLYLTTKVLEARKWT